MFTKNNPLPKATIMSVHEAIYQRRAIRNYKPDPISPNTIRTLLDAAVQAPTAMHEEPWAFAVIQNQEILDRLSEHAKYLVRKEASVVGDGPATHALNLVNKPDFHVFYNASTLIVIYSKLQGPFVEADCWLAAQNLMLAAYAQGLGSCVIGFSVSALNVPEWKAELGVPEDMMAIAPVIVGVPNGITQAIPRKSPEIITWK